MMTNDTGNAEIFSVYRRFSEELARRVGDQLNKESQQKKEIDHKGAVDLVTQFDRRSQDIIVSAIEKRFPEHGIVSEEDVTKNTDKAVKWIVDPLDGTTNFTHGLPIWSISIALEYHGSVVAGVVYDPTRRELFSAQQGKGVSLNTREIQVSRERDLDKALVVTGFPYDIRESDENNLDNFGKFALCTQAVRRLGSAALDLCYVACGRFDGYWELKLSPWDQAAGSLIVQEAGGRITDFKGAPFSIYGNQVLATNGFVHEQMITILNRNP